MCKHVIRTSAVYIDMCIIFTPQIHILYSILFIDLIAFSHKLISKIQPVVTRCKNTIRKERTYDVLYSPYKEKAEMVQKRLGKSDIYNPNQCVTVAVQMRLRTLTGRRFFALFRGLVWIDCLLTKVLSPRRNATSTPFKHCTRRPPLSVQTSLRSTHKRF